MSSSFSIDADLVRAIKDKKCAVFVGAGLSRRVGFPSWQELLGQLIDRAVTDGLLPERGKKLADIKKHAKQPNDALMVAEELSDVLGGGFRDELVKIFNQKLALSKAHELLTKLPMSFVVTTNYDRLLERAYTKALDGDAPPIYNYTQAADFGSALWADEFFILKAHGDVTTRESMVITERDYRKLIHSASGYRSTMSAIFTMKTMLFIGVSMNDPEMKLMLGHMYDAFNGSGPRHYAFVPNDQFSSTEIGRWLKDYKIKCMPYTPSNETHPELDEFLTELHTLI